MCWRIRSSQPLCYSTMSAAVKIIITYTYFLLLMSLGYPAPELKWYKDDMEMDRYCGLPKYEIRRNGKTHTLHIYKYMNNFISMIIYLIIII